jgi:hypothetical protein
VINPLTPTDMKTVTELKKLNVNDTIFTYWVELEDFNKINEGYLPKIIKADGAGAVLQGKEEYYDNVTRNTFTPTYRLKEDYIDTIFEGLTHQFMLESIFDENGMNKAFVRHIEMLR